MGRVENKVALVTGGAGGIGSAIVKLLVQKGATVVIADTDHNKGHALAAEVGKQALYLPLDVTEENQWLRTLETVLLKFGQLNVLVNNAGFLEPSELDETSVALWQKTLAVNATSVFLGCKYGVESMKKTGGAIVNMASTAVPRPGTTFLAYSAAKAAVVSLTKTVALDCAHNNYGIRCNVVLPGAVDTDMLRNNKEPDQSDEDFIGSVIARYPMGRIGQPEDIAEAVLFLVSDDSAFMTGAELRVDGGSTI